MELRAVRERMARRIAHKGVFAFYCSLRGRAAKLMALHPSPRRAAQPRGIAARAAKRRALVDALPESSAIRELRRIRAEMMAEEKRVGSDKYWAGFNEQGKKYARRLGLKYADAPSSVDVLRDQPVKKRKAC